MLYAGAFIAWTRYELREIVRKTRKVLTINGALHPRANTSRLCVSRNGGGRALISVEDSVDKSILGLKNYVSESTRTLLSAVRVTDECDLDNTDQFKNREQKERQDKWPQIVMLYQFVIETAELADTKSRLWLLLKGVVSLKMI